MKWMLLLVVCMELVACEKTIHEASSRPGVQPVAVAIERSAR